MLYLYVKKSNWRKDKTLTFEEIIRVLESSRVHEIDFIVPLSEKERRRRLEIWLANEMVDRLKSLIEILGPFGWNSFVAIRAKTPFHTYFNGDLKPKWLKGVPEKFFDKCLANQMSPRVYPWGKKGFQIIVNLHL